MPSTHKRRLSDFLKLLGNSATSNFDHMEVRRQERAVELSASGAQPFAIFHAEGLCVLKRIFFLPDIAVASNVSDKWVVEFKNVGVSGVGTTSLGTFSTYASDTATINSALVALMHEHVLSRETTELELVKDTVVTATCTKSASAADLVGKFIVEYIPLLD
jgi:hypothetical protein